ncbi:hypothetical protein [Oleiagrimonas sp. C23AA]|uniref:hypothetical protein n=1 Tax=Oleiagrimonas sp. C23AA TaxID=2719047 RepID=UPI001421B4E3|nr:hypothetical protein [Oleiagrimonas sp. C23AA]NII09286.1 hypothetical protein [Oleiagrimonas sp. C23AA]
MARERILACVGVNNIELARLRLLLRLAAPRLDDHWQFGEVERADVLIVQPGSHEADAAALRARGRGVRCVAFGGEGKSREVLPANFETEDVARVLNAEAGQSRGSRLQLLDPDSPDFFGDDDGVPLGVGEGRLQPTQLDELFRTTRDAPPMSSLVPGTVSGATLEDIRASSGRVHRRERDDNPFFMNEPEPDQPTEDNFRLSPGDVASRLGPGAHRRPIDSRGKARPLIEYLEEGALAGPNRIEREGHPPLILDPKWKCYHIEGDLAAVDIYVNEPLPVAAWIPVTSSQLEQARKVSPGRAYLRLRWLYALRHAGGWLPRQLDPGGSYWLRRVLDLDDHFAAQRRIGEALVDEHRLHEVVSMAEVSMAEVFDTVAAYDAIGLLQWKPRERFR